MIYVLDTNSLRVMCENFYESRFPSVWEKVEALIREGRLISVREAYRETKTLGVRRLKEWAKTNRSIFLRPSPQELIEVRRIFDVAHFQQVVSQKAILQGRPVADPFLVAKAMVIDGTVVTQEAFRDNAAKIPNICDHFSVRWTDLEGLMTSEGWVF